MGKDEPVPVRSDARAITELWEDMGELTEDHTRILEEGKTESTGMEMLKFEHPKSEPERTEGSGPLE